MPIFVYVEQDLNNFTSQSLEAVSYAQHIANIQNIPLIALCINAQDTQTLQKYGVNKIIHIKNENLKLFNAQSFARALADHIEGLTIFPHTPETSAIAAMLSVLKKQPIITQIIDLPQNISPLIIERLSFGGKVKMKIESKAPHPILTLAPHSFKIKENPVLCIEEIKNIESNQHFHLITQENKSQKQDLNTAEIVVCAGRGLKSPENWKMIENLAEILEGATACTRPISDMGWRDYNEHAGQTGKTISPKLYIGIGISGATQHIAGIQASKCIIVINNDPNAAFFKYANYGIIGDAFTIVPRLTEKIKAFKNTK